jgi:hypothetical protein
MNVNEANSNATRKGRYGLITGDKTPSTRLPASSRCQEIAKEGNRGNG